LKGEGFSPLRRGGDAVRAGEPLIAFQADYVAMHAPSLLTEVIVATPDRVERLVKRDGYVEAGRDTILEVIFNGHGAPARAPDATAGERMTSHEIRVRKLVAGTRVRVVLVLVLVQLALLADDVRVAIPRALEWIEIVAVADIDDGLATIVDFLEVPDHVVRGGEGNVRAVPQLGRPVRTIARLNDLARLQRSPGHLLDRFVEPLPVVGEVDCDRRCARGHHAEHVALVHQLIRDFLEQLLQARGVGEVEVEVVHEEQQDATGSIVGRPRRWQDDAFLRRRRRRQQLVEDAASVHQGEGGNLLLDAVLEHLEFVFLQVGHELAAVVAGDDISRHEVDGDTECRLRLLATLWRGLTRLRGGSLALLRRGSLPLLRRR